MLFDTHAHMDDHAFDTDREELLRSLPEQGLTLVMKSRLSMQSQDAICGFKFFRKTFVEELIAQADRKENGWFFIIELLIRAERSGKRILELPVRYTEEEGGHVHVVKQTLNYLHNIEKLRRTLEWNSNA